MPSPKLRYSFVFPVSFLLSVFLSACNFGGGGHGGGHGGGGVPQVGLGFSPSSTSSIMLFAGSSGTLTLIVDNIGNLASSGAFTVSFPLTNGGSPTGVTFNPSGSGGSGWDCSASTSTNVSCTTQASIAPGANAPTLTVVLNAAANASPLGTQPTVSGGNNSNAGQQSYTLNVNVVLPPNLTVTKTHVGTKFTAGNSGQYTIVVVNNGNGAANNVQVTDQLPSGLTYMSASGPSWSCSTAGQPVTVTCAYAVALDPGSTANTLTLNVTVASNANSTISNTAHVTATGDIGSTGKSSTDMVTVVLSTGNVSVTITEPTSSTVTLGTDGTLDLIALLQNFTTNEIDWSVNGVQSGNSTVGMITSTTMSGGTAVYTAPGSVPSSNNPVTISATAKDNPLATQSVSVTIVLNRNSALTGQFALTMHGFQPNGLPFAATGTFTAAGDAAGTMSKIFIDTNVGATSTSSTFTPKSQWNGSYNMDSATHGIMHLTLQSNTSITATVSFVLGPAGNFGYLAENDSPNGNSGSGEFHKQDTSSFDTAAGHITGSWIFRHGRGRIGQVNFAATSSTINSVNGQEDDSTGVHDTISNGTLTLDTDGTGHGVITFPLVTAMGTIRESVYIVGGANGVGLMYMINQGTGSGNTPTGSLAYQTTASGYTTANAFPGVTAFAVQGANSNGHYSVYVGQISPHGSGTLNVGMDYNDGGTVLDGGCTTCGGVATYSMDAAGTGRGTTAVSGMLQAGVTFVLYLRAPSEGYLLETTAGASNEGRAGMLQPQTTTLLTLANPTVAFAGVRSDVPASLDGVSYFTMTQGASPGHGSITNGIEDVSQVSQSSQFGVPIPPSGINAPYDLGAGIDGPGTGAIALNSPGPVYPSLFGSNEIAIVAGSNGTIFGVPFYYGNAAQVLDPQLIIITVP